MDATPTGAASNPLPATGRRGPSAGELDLRQFLEVLLVGQHLCRSLQVRWQTVSGDP
ncbi:hypothetical protein [Actinoplanes sp. NPDC049118]|uniref:hypothetical protein n=1 Tax=Actinoplanes sp. NPDC049118 TaxID=3155769 RepID=UPI0033D7235C